MNFTSVFVFHLDTNSLVCLLTCCSIVGLFTCQLACFVYTIVTRFHHHHLLTSSRRIRPCRHFMGFPVVEHTREIRVMLGSLCVEMYYVGIPHKYNGHVTISGMHVVRQCPSQTLSSTAQRAKPHQTTTEEQTKTREENVQTIPS